MPFSPDGTYKVGEISFDPKDAMVKVKGSTTANYLEVKYRLIMLREMFPEAKHSTEILFHNPQGGEGGMGVATVQATIELPNGAKGQGIKTEERKHFTDYLEKAETGATGRALYAVGIGAQYSKVEYDYEAESPKEFKGVDSPVKQAAPKTDKSELLAKVFQVSARLPSGTMAKRSEELFKTTQSTQLSEDQLKTLIAWGEAQG